MVDISRGAGDLIPPAEVPDVELYHAKSWITKYVFCQDAKVIAIQYSVTALSIGMVALVLSWLMRLQLGFPGVFSFIDAEHYYQFITMHGMIMVIYLITAIFLGGFGNYLIPADAGRAGHGVPVRQYAELLGLSACGAGPGGQLFRAGRADRRRWTLYPPQAILSGTAGFDWGIILMLISLILFIIGFTHGWPQLRRDDACRRVPRGMTLMRHAPDGLGDLHRDRAGAASLPSLVRGLRDAAV
jgi:cytochrome c oxidase subunit 1